MSGSSSITFVTTVITLLHLVSASSTPKQGPGCDQARILCAFRAGCGAALTHYMNMCSEVIAEGGGGCPVSCQHALIALTSTEEGKQLMNCECNNDDYCLETKSRIDVCRPHVENAVASGNITCRLSQLICAADTLCSTALEYYSRYCRSTMYHGKKCSRRCLNSISILSRQEKASMLANCICDGYEDYDCPKIQSNMDRLCFHKKKLGESPKHREEMKESVIKKSEAEIRHENDVLDLEKVDVSAGDRVGGTSLTLVLLSVLALSVELT